MKKDTKDNLIQFLLDRNDELIERVVKSETRRKEVLEELEFAKKMFVAAMQRPVAIGLTEEQVNRIISGVGDIVTKALMEKGHVH